MGSPARHPIIPREVVDVVARSEISGIKEDVNALSHKIESLASKHDINFLSEAIQRIALKQDSSSRPNFQVLLSSIALGVTILIAIGGFAYWPITATQADLKETIKTLSERVVYQRRYDSNYESIGKQFDQLRKDKADKDVLEQIEKRISTIVPRAEVNAIIGDRDARINGAIRRIERLETLTLGVRPTLRLQGD